MRYAQKISQKQASTKVKPTLVFQKKAFIPMRAVPLSTVASKPAKNSLG